MPVMLVVESFIQRPGCCWHCRSEQHLPAVDLLRDIDQEGYDGHAYLCKACIGALADLMGWISPEKADELRAAATAGEAEVERLTSELADVEKALDAMTKVRTNRTSKKVPE